ncbi:hypothetical protein ABE288_18515 [Bacillus salipaludis]|uniref:hypothetical protein n=1 Tax=Bacillus salipaludis TaxID=2547811 RepID=UPI003D220B36
MSLEEQFNLLRNRMETVLDRPLTDEEKNYLINGLNSDPKFFDAIQLKMDYSFPQKG